MMFTKEELTAIKQLVLQVKVAVRSPEATLLEGILKKIEKEVAP